MGTNRIALLGIGLILVAVVTGWQVLSRSASTPGRTTAVDRAQDLTRAATLQQLAAVISGHYESSGVLPATLAELVGAGILDAVPTDPVTQQAYAYEPEADGSYALCAVFDAPGEDGELPEFWMHEAGRYCFRLSPAYGEY